jgi:hypothetical protein
MRKKCANFAFPGKAGIEGRIDEFGPSQLRGILFGANELQNPTANLNNRSHISHTLALEPASSGARREISAMGNPTCNPITKNHFWRYCKQSIQPHMVDHRCAEVAMEIVPIVRNLVLHNMPGTMYTVASSLGVNSHPIATPFRVQ